VLEAEIAVGEVADNLVSRLAERVVHDGRRHVPPDSVAQELSRLNTRLRQILGDYGSTNSGPG
jgi:hypothetical protein